jgi:glycosyltransferase involved in cell wall biosynthesis
LYERAEKLFLHGVDGFIFPSKTTESAVRSLALEDKPYIIANPGKDSVQGGVSPDDVISRSRESGPLRILFVGNLISRKGLHTLLDALAKLPTGQWILRVVGNTKTDPHYTRDIHEQVQRLGLEGGVDFLGTVTGERLSHLYRSSHILAVPSSYEGFGMVYVEGMAFGLPAIASTFGAAHEIVKHGVNGFLIEPDDTEALADHLLELVSDRHKLAEMGLMALKSHDEHPSWCETGERIRSLLVKMANPRENRGSSQ